MDENKFSKQSILELALEAVSDLSIEAADKIDQALFEKRLSIASLLLVEEPNDDEGKKIHPSSHH